MILIIIPVAIITLLLVLKYLAYRKSAYGLVSGIGFLRTIFDKGNHGEFLTFSYLEKLEGYNLLMTNLYIPKKDGTTTEIDLLMLSQKGIYVFESKNFSGWIFGDENSKNWTQTLENRQKIRFYNPIWQNNGHISALKHYLGLHDQDLYKSFIVFSERCTLKQITVSSPNVKVVKRNDLVQTIKRDIGLLPELLTVQEVDNIYAKLSALTLVDKAVKQAHIDEIRSRVS